MMILSMVTMQCAFGIERIKVTKAKFDEIKAPKIKAITEPEEFDPAENIKNIKQFAFVILAISGLDTEIAKDADKATKEAHETAMKTYHEKVKAINEALDIFKRNLIMFVGDKEKGGKNLKTVVKALTDEQTDDYTKLHEIYIDVLKTTRKKEEDAAMKMVEAVEAKIEGTKRILSLLSWTSINLLRKIMPGFHRRLGPFYDPRQYVLEAEGYTKHIKPFETALEEELNKTDTDVAKEANSIFKAVKANFFTHWYGTTQGRIGIGIGLGAAALGTAGLALFLAHRTGSERLERWGLYKFIALRPDRVEYHAQNLFKEAPGEYREKMIKDFNSWFSEANVQRIMDAEATKRAGQ